MAKAISGFGNSEGGVVIWGLDCAKDLDGADAVKAKYLILDVKKLASWIEGAVSGCTIPPHSGVVNHPVHTDETEQGFVVTYIPKSENVPHQVIGENRYYIRAGSSFATTPHQVLAGMFGRRPQPRIVQKFEARQATIEGDKIQCALGFIIRNGGPVIAKDLFVSCAVLSSSGPNCQVVFRPCLEYFTGFQSYGFSFSITSNEDLKLPPYGVLPAAHLVFAFRPPFQKELSVRGVFGCDKIPPYHFSFQREQTLIEAMYNKVMAHEGTAQEDEVCTEFWRQILDPNQPSGNSPSN